jgi:pyrroline-5-carboxylate reductase
VKTTVFIGGGRITSALLSGLQLSDFQTPILVHDRNLHKLRALQKKFRVAVEPDLAKAVAQARLLVLAVRPADVGEVLKAIRGTPALAQRRPEQAARIACSLAAGIPLAKLRKMLGSPFRWVRAMPSPVARSGNGLTALAFAQDFPRASRTFVRHFFMRVGSVIEIPEPKFDAFTVTYSASHGYHALAALAQAAQKLGLDRETAYLAAAHALADGIVSWREGKETLEELLQEAATPGGTAETTLRAMDEAGYGRAVEQGLRAGWARTRRNAK